VTAAEVRARLEEAVRPYHIPEWELEEFAEGLEDLPPDAQRRVVDLVPSIWPVSHALTFTFLRNARRGLEVFGETRLQVWVGAILDAYEAGGLEEARPVVADGGRAFLAELRGESGVRFRDAAPMLLPYACGLAERSLEVAEGREASTDTAVVLLPRRIAVLEEAADNLLLYKLAVAVQCGHITGGTYRAELPGGHPLLAGLRRRHGREWADAPAWLESFFGLFPDPVLAARLFQAAATARVAGRIAASYPGLAREAAPVLAACFAARPAPGALAPREGLLEAIRRWTWTGEAPDGGEAAAAVAVLAPVRDAAASPAAAVLAAAGLYGIAAGLAGGEPASTPPPFEGLLRPAAAEERRRARRAEAREQFVEAFRALYLRALERGGAAEEGPREPEPGSAPPPQPEAGGVAAARPDAAGEGGEERAGTPGYIRIGAQLVEVPEGVRPLVDEIRDALGGVPASYVSGVLAAAGRARGRFAGPEVPDGPPAEETFVYDEWDFRRAGYRKSWCSLYALELAPGDPAVVERAVRTHRGPILRIRRAFEQMRTVERFRRGQRDGDEIDVDAVIAARADLAAGRPASDRLFIRLARDTRDIAAVFLVDMSSSTEGWVSEAIRDSLVLLCEGLEVLGDRYAIYGFSGMRRLRAELYRIKTLEEAYGAAVKGRIAAIGPRDYTRMGPPIRHATRLLRETDAKVRLLVTLSDGRPEDYDEYKGDYAIEDTRHALVEAKVAGVHPFCITIDREAPAYIRHLFGEVNYVVIDDPAKLPLRIPDIYRTLTK